MDLEVYIEFISNNYYVEVHDGKIELLPFNNMQLPILLGFDDERFNNDGCVKFK